MKNNLGNGVGELISRLKHVPFPFHGMTAALGEASMFT